MKTIYTTLLLTFLSIGIAQAQNLKEGRAVYSYIDCLLDPEIIKSLDNDKLTASNQKVHLRWKKKFKMQLEQQLLDKMDAYLKSNNVDIQPMETIAKIHSGSEGSFPSVLFPKKLLKKKAKDADIGEHFVSAALAITKPLFPKLMKPYSLEYTLTLKIFNNEGKMLKKLKKEIKSESTMGGMKVPDDEKLFSKIADESIDWFLEHFGGATEQVVAEAFDELLKGEG